MPTVIPSRSSATISSIVMRLSRTVFSALLLGLGLGRAGELVPFLVGGSGEVDLEGEALLVAVGALDVDGVDAVQGGLGGSHHGGVLGRDLGRDFEGSLVELLA